MVQGEFLKEVEFIEGDEEGENRDILLGEETEKITHCRGSEEEEALFPQGESALNIKENREEVEHSGHGGHSLNDVGDGLGLDGVA